LPNSVNENFQFLGGGGERSGERSGGERAPRPERAPQGGRGGKPASPAEAGQVAEGGGEDYDFEDIPF